MTESVISTEENPYFDHLSTNIGLLPQMKASIHGASSNPEMLSVHTCVPSQTATHDLVVPKSIPTVSQ
jgi:hypothetical protein